MAVDLTPEARIGRAMAVVREQRDPSGEYGALGHPEHGPVASSAVEAFYLQEIGRLQRAVMGEADPDVWIMENHSTTVTFDDSLQVAEVVEDGAAVYPRPRGESDPVPS